MSERDTGPAERMLAEFERWPPGVPRDETDVSLRAYVGRIPDEKIRAYRLDWSDDEVIAWDGNFRSDGCLMLVCCERDVDVAEFRRVIGEFLAFRRFLDEVRTAQSIAPIF